MSKSGMFRFFRPKSGIFASSSSIIAFVGETQLCSSAIRSNTPCGVRYVVQVALLLSCLGPPWFSERCALGCSAAVAFGCVCFSHVSGWLTSVEVLAVVPLGVSCFLWCLVGDTLWPVRTMGRRQVVSSRHSAASGSRVMRARLVFWRSGASGMGANAVDGKSTFFVLNTSACRFLMRKVS